MTLNDLLPARHPVASPHIILEVSQPWVSALFTRGNLALGSKVMQGFTQQKQVC